MPQISDFAKDAGATPSEPEFSSLANHFLIAMPHMRDAIFAKSVVYVCDHSERGALGLVINKPSPDMSMEELFGKIDLSLTREDMLSNPVFQGGPVHTERGFVLHERMSDKEADASAGVEQPTTFDKLPAYASTLFITDSLEVTTSKDVLEALADGAGPKHVFISLGYSAWGAGQLESELGENSWLTVPADVSLIFDTPVAERYRKALSLLGIEEMALSSLAGHA